MVVVIVSLPSTVVAVISRFRPGHLRPAHRLGLGEHLGVRQHPPGTVPRNVLLAQQVPFFDLTVVNEVQPVRKTVTTLCDLQLNGGNDAVVVIRVQVVHGGQGVRTVGHDHRAHVGVGVAGPGHGCVLGRVNRVARDPVSRLGRVVAVVDLGDERGGPALGVAEIVAADERLGHVRVPVRVEVVRVALVRAVSTSVKNQGSDGCQSCLPS